MDSQLKKGLLDVCVLSVLRRGESYGYKILTDVAPCIEIAVSTLYPILKRMEGAGCLLIPAFAWLTVHCFRLFGRICKATGRYIAGNARR